MKPVHYILILIFTSVNLFAQSPEKASSVEIFDAIQKLQFLGSVMYVGAHPDDENNNMITYLANQAKAHTTYLSLTRGDGGQNVLGTELKEYLGVLRTQELLKARTVDKGHQLFSRAIDFGYSKNAEETLEFWDRTEVLSDVVWAIRKHQPDIIINRFHHDSSGKTHGHHTGSAILSFEAFDLTNDSSNFPSQLEYTNPWQAKKLFINQSWFFNGGRENFNKMDKSSWHTLDMGVYYPYLGESNNEIAAESRSQHRCQTMGTTPRRGSRIEYLELVKGEKTDPGRDIFYGINTSWSRLKGGGPIGKILSEVESEFDFKAPSASVPKLLKAKKLIENLPYSIWKDIKLEDIKKVIIHCMGLYIDAVANTNYLVPGDEIEVNTELANRSSHNTHLVKCSIHAVEIDSTFNLGLENNVSNKINFKIKTPKSLSYTNSYWLNKKGTYGMYEVDEQILIGLPETPRELKIDYFFEILGEEFSLTKDINYKETDQIEGELFKPLEVVAPVSSNILKSVYVFADDNPKEVDIVVKSASKDLEGVVGLEAPPGWKVSPENFRFVSQIKGEELQFTFTLFPSEDQSVGEINSFVKVGDSKYNQSLIEIEYDHISPQMVYRKSVAKVVRVDLKKEGEKIGYIMGAGDDVPNSLEEIGYRVDILDGSDIKNENLKQYDAVILGVRAFNTNKKLNFLNKELMDYVFEGGNVIVQYNWNRRLVTEDLGPYPLNLIRDRVSVETAEVKVLEPNHLSMQFPNRITEKDFDDWVQERGLYFPNEWDEKYTPIFSSHDPGETPKKGGLLVAEYGKGYYVYTGFSWFRQLPAGVPGAFRIFTNLISLNKESRP